MFQDDPTYVNPRILTAYVKEIVKRKTVKGGGHELGVSIEEIFDDISFIFQSQYGRCPFKINDIEQIMQATENNFPVFSNSISYDNKILWKLAENVSHPQIFFEPIKHEVKEKQKTFSASIDYESMIKDEEELENDLEKLREKQIQLEKRNTELRVSQRLFIEPNTLDQTLRTLDTSHYVLTDSYEMLHYKVEEVISAIDDALYL